LLGVVRQGTPFYAGYEARPLVELESIVSRFVGERRQFIGDIFAAARKGRIWYGLDPTAVATRLGDERERVLKALHYLEEQGLIELRASDVRLHFTRVDGGRTELDVLLVSL